MTKVRIFDATLRDGMHAVSHSFTPKDMAEIARGLDLAGVDTIEIGHGDGLGGSSYQYGFSAATDAEYLEAVAGSVSTTNIDVLLIPGIGTKKDLEMASRLGAKVVRVATHVTEADTGEQHIRLARDLGMEAIGFLMMSHMAPVQKVIEQAMLFESYGAEAIYLTDSAGAMLPTEVTEKITALKKAVSVPIGFHAHNNLSLAIGNTVAAVLAGARYIDGTLRGLGAGAGNAPTEVLVAVMEKAGYYTGVNLYKAMDVAEEVLQPKLKRPMTITNDSLVLGYAGVYGSFLLHARRAADRFGVDSRDIILELGKRKTVGGQEDLIIEVAEELASKEKQDCNEGEVKVRKQ